jgi:hypothetical protein
MERRQAHGAQDRALEPAAGAGRREGQVQEATSNPASGSARDADRKGRSGHSVRLVTAAAPRLTPPPPSFRRPRPASAADAPALTAASCPARSAAPRSQRAPDAGGCCPWRNKLALPTRRAGGAAVGGARSRCLLPVAQQTGLARASGGRRRRGSRPLPVFVARGATNWPCPRVGRAAPPWVAPAPGVCCPWRRNKCPHLRVIPDEFRWRCHHQEEVPLSLDTPAGRFQIRCVTAS